MTRPSLPSSLRPRVSDYGFNSPAGADSSAVEGGVDRYGLAYESAAQIFSVTLILDLYEFSVWNLFYLRKTALGTITFDMVLDSGHGLAPHACNIVTGSYSAKRTAGNAGMVVTFQVQAESQAFEFLDDDVDAQLAVFEVFGRQGPGMLTRIGVFANFDTLAFADFPAVNMVTVDVDSAITFNRAGPKTYFDQAGILRTAAANVWPLEYHPVTRRALGRRVEPARTNVLKNASFEDVNTTVAPVSWTFEQVSGAAVLSKTAVYGNYGVKAERATFNMTAAAGYVTMVQTTSGPAVGARLTAQCKVRMSIAGTVRMYIQALNAASTLLATYTSDLFALAASQTAFTPISFTTASGLPADTVSVRLFARVFPGAVGSGTLVDWDDAQLEEGLVASSFIFTDGAAVTRPADFAQLTVPAGRSSLTYSFSDGTTTTVAVTAGSVHTVPDTFFPKYITRMVWG